MVLPSPLVRFPSRLDLKQPASLDRSLSSVRRRLALNSGGITVPRQIECLILFVSLCSPLMFADQIVLKNGDRLTGTVVKSDGKILVLHTEFAGDVTLKYEAITQITADEQLHVGLKNGQTVVGPITTSD